MASQRPSTAKKKAYAGASRSQLEKKLDELLELAKNIKEESVFKHENQYKKFKKNPLCCFFVIAKHEKSFEVCS